MNKIDEYLQNEQSNQFSQEKMDQIHEQKLGKAKLGSNIQRLAQIKGWNVKECQICGEPVLSKDLRTVAVLCRNHMGLKSITENLLSKRKKSSLNSEDIKSLIKSRTVRTGPFWPNQEAKQ